MQRVEKWSKWGAYNLGGMQKAVKWTSTNVDTSTDVDEHRPSTGWKSAVWSTSTKKSTVASTSTVNVDKYNYPIPSKCYIVLNHYIILQAMNALRVMDRYGKEVIQVST